MSKIREAFENQPNPEPGEPGYNIHRGDFQENRAKEVELQEEREKKTEEFENNLPDSERELLKIQEELEKNSREEITSVPRFGNKEKKDAVDRKLRILGKNRE